MYKIFAFVALLAAVNAGEYQATSFASFNDNHNSVQHLGSAPAPVKYAVPAAPVYAAPAVAKYAVPAVAKYAVPAITKYAAPVAKLAVPAVTSYYSAPAPQYSAPVYGSPAVAKVALPVAKFAPVSYAAPVTKYVSAPAYSTQQEEYAPAKYEYTYGIEDAHTGDFHSQQEQRDGDHVVGQYSLHEADGTVRIVKYSDEGHGFNAVVEKQGTPTEAPTVYKKVVAVAAPQYNHYYH